MSIRSFIIGEFCQLGMDPRPDWEAIFLARRNRERSISGELTKPAITVEAACGFDPIGRQFSYIEDVIYDAIYSVDNRNILDQLENVIEMEEKKQFARLAAEKSMKSNSIGDRTSGKDSKLRGRGRKQAERYYPRD